MSLLDCAGINYNHFQTGRTKTESWSRSVQGTMMMMMMMKLYFHRVAPSAYFADLPGGPEYG